VEFSDPKETEVLLVGYSADVEIVLDTRADALRVPTSAIQEGSKVLVHVPESGRLEERTVTTGLSNWQYTEVLAGLSAGERVVLSLERPGVKAGAKARPQSEEDAGT
jgi:HlyD family secretion protein